MSASTGKVPTRPNVVGATFDVLSVVSPRLAPDSPESCPRCSTACCARNGSPKASISVRRKRPKVLFFKRISLFLFLFGRAVPPAFHSRCNSIFIGYDGQLRLVWPRRLRVLCP